jgi:hypothetical protein
MSQPPVHYQKDDTQPITQTQPLPQVPQPEAPPPPPAPKRPFGYVVLWLLVAILLLANAFLINQVLLMRHAAQQAVADAITVVDDAQEFTYSDTVVINQSVAIQVDLPVNETIPVVIDQDIPIDTVVEVPVDTRLFGTITLDVPIRTTIPVHVEQDIVIDQTFPIDTAVPINLDLPITLSVADTELETVFEDLEARLTVIDNNLNAPLIANPFAQ